MTKNGNGPLVLILAVGVFGILNTEMGIIGILPLISETFGIGLTQAALLVSGFALMIAVSAPVLPLLFSTINRKTVMLLALSVFVVSNILSIFAPNFAILMMARLIPAAFHPIYVSLAFTVAAESVEKSESAKAVAKVFIGVSAGLVLGVPITSLIATELSFQAAMVFFTAVNAAVLLATLVMMPSMPVSQRLTYGSQIRVLKKTGLQMAILISILLNGAVFGFFSYLSDFLDVVTGLNTRAISLLLLVYGAANIVGNIIAGRVLTDNAEKTFIAVPILLLALFGLIFLTGHLSAAASLIVPGLGILAGIVANANQYLITEAATEAPVFANGLYLTAQNLGLTVGTPLCGLFLNALSTRFTLIGSIIMLSLCLIALFIRLRIRAREPKRFETPACLDDAGIA